jgi:MoaA/NifB/PqqE/SkfB family radical SAM enzyme
MSNHSPLKFQDIRLPLEGHIDLTYRCNNTCRHCWLSIPANDPAREREISFDEIKNIVGQARAMGTRRWSISGGEPMLRPDFPEIFDLLTARAVSYTLNTNGTLITPELARLLTRKGTKMIALYGATPETYERVTRHPGGFEMVMRGFRYLKEAGAGFIVQLIPMRDNRHEWPQMLELARSLSKHWRVGAPWLYLSAGGDPERNAEIARQRLDPKDVVEMDQPDPSQDDGGGHEYEFAPAGQGLFARCIAGRRDFHIDPYGAMTFCSFLKDPAMRYDLRRGSFQEAWDIFIPSLAAKATGDAEHEKHCGSCEKRADCRWCPVYGWLEHGRFTARVEHLCEVAEENKRFKADWRTHHRRYFETAGITLQVDSDLPIDDRTFHPKFEAFRVNGPGPDTVTIRHHFSLPDLEGRDLGTELYRKPPWAIYRQNGSYIYLGISPQAGDPSLHRVATFNKEHTKTRVYNDREEIWLKGDLHSLTMFPSDQILIARLLADRQGCYMHSAGAILNGAGLLFVGHSEAGKSTITRLLIAAGDGKGRGAGAGEEALESGGTREGEGIVAGRGENGGQNGMRSEGQKESAREAAGRDAHASAWKIAQSENSPRSTPAASAGPTVEILCDDRNIVRLRDDGWRVYGTWSHGEVPVVSAASALLRAICFIEKANENTLTTLVDQREITRRLLACLIRPFVTADWWNKTLDLIERMAPEIPAYVMRFDKSGDIVRELEALTRKTTPAR